MMSSINAYYNGFLIVVDEQVELTKGQRLIITILDNKKDKKLVDRINIKSSTEHKKNSW